MAMNERQESTRRSWDRATQNHNRHKGDQAAFFRGGGDVLFPEELELLGELAGRSLVHLQCNAGQDSLGLARRGALVTGVDFSSEAIRFARELSAASGIPATFIEGELLEWTQRTEERFDLAFASYGVIGWHEDAAAWMRGAARVLRPGGRLIYVEFHPLVWSYGKALDLTGDDYFQRGPFVEPVGDYVAESGTGLWSETGEAGQNDLPAYSYQHTLGEIVEACLSAGLRLELLREYPYSNGFRPSPALVAGEGRRWLWPEGKARLPLMFGLRAVKGL